MRFGTVPHEVPVQRDLSLCAPRFAQGVGDLLRAMARFTAFNVDRFETLRTQARQQFLYGFGRMYDDGRGIVTYAPDAYTSWHGYGLAVDIVEKDATPWNVPTGLWDALGAQASQEGLAWGGHWTTPDRPHVQWLQCPASPTSADRALVQSGGLEAVWRKYGAL